MPSSGRIGRGSCLWSLIDSSTLRLGPDLAGYRSVIGKCDIAVNWNQWISLERKQFLAERFLYWDKWAGDHSGYYLSGYQE
jgi:hypothetical protein